MKAPYTLLLLLVSFVGLSSFLSCSHDGDFDKELYRYYVKESYPVDTLEQAHPWTLLRRHYVTVTAGVSDDYIRELRLYDGHPSNGDLTSQLAASDIRRDMSVTVAYDLAQCATNTLYAALVTSTGTTYVTPFAIGQDSVLIAPGNMTRLSVMPTTDQQTFTYLFESSFPTPEDFDYNDVVLRISRKAPNTNHLQLTVTLSAAGCTKQVAGAIRLPGVDYDQVSHVTITGSEDFDEGYPYAHQKLDISGNLGRSRGGDAVIRLFEDAHWSLTKTLDKLGSVEYVPLNTEHFQGGDTVTVWPALTRTYNIFLRDGANADSIRLADIDPFIVEVNGVITFEVHTYAHKFEEAIWHYLGAGERTYDDYLAWALVIPDGRFRYPIEGVPLGIFRNGELFGAYGKPSHSFGQWARNFRESFDWWQHPITTLIY